jgi:hypothetical protein
MRFLIPSGLTATVVLLSTLTPAWSGSEPAAAVKTRSRFAPTPLIDVSGKSDFPDPAAVNDEAAAQLPGLCSLQEFRDLPAGDRHVYSFDPWPGQSDALGEKDYTFNLKLGQTGVTHQKVAFAATGGGPGGSHDLIRVKTGEGQYSLRGLGNLDWNGTTEHRFVFDKPVVAFGVVLNSSADMDLRKFYWPAAKDRNGYPISYTLADGSVINLGTREVRGALLKGGSDAFLGVMDRSGCGIISISYTLKGLAGNKAQSLGMKSWAIATMPKPAVAPVINLRSSCDFYNPEDIAPSPGQAVPGLTSLDAFRFIVGNHRYVYHCDTWPSAKTAVAGGTGEFAFDLKGKGAVGQKLTFTATNSGKDVRLTQTTLTDAVSMPYQVLGGLGNVGQGAWAEHTFKFTKPVWAFGVAYRSPKDLSLAGSSGYPVSYTLSDGTVVNVGDKGGVGGVIAAGTKTFVGVTDKTDKGISSVTVRLQGDAKAAQAVYVEDIAFALAGPPPGNWQLTLDEQFDGNQLNPKLWTTGYTYPDVINNELQGYVPENVTVADGLCTIKVEQRNCVNTDRTGRKGAAQKFASGAFTSFDKFTQTYGYFEARLKMPHARGAGIWPAFWMLPDRGKAYPQKIRTSYMTKDYGRGMEIDLFEFMPWWKRPDGTFPIHVGCIWNYGPVTEKNPAPHGYGSYALGNDGWGPEEMDFPALDDEFHTYGLYWSPERLIYYLDGKPIFRVKDPQHVPDVPHYFLFNVAMSGNGWGKSVDKKHPTTEQIVEDLPNAMQIDYFRAYSGTLEEPIPAAPTDIPGPVTKYKPPVEDPASPPPTAVTPPPAPAGEVPPPPANVGITTPAAG